jgi:hypothetical protein
MAGGLSNFGGSEELPKHGGCGRRQGRNALSLPNELGHAKKVTTRY